jgi:hypothetical protein
MKTKKTKSKAASEVLRLIDNDLSYTKALNKFLKSDKGISKKNLEKEFKQYI